MAQFLDIDVAAGRYESAAFPMTQGQFTVQADFTKIKGEAVVMVLQSLDGISFSPILDDRDTPVKMRLTGSGSKTINMVGAYSSQGKVLVNMVPHSEGTIDLITTLT